MSRRPYCPTGVREWIDEGGEVRYRVNAANCIHCKTCGIEGPKQNMKQVPPEGGGGPRSRGL
ncbi:MAG: 4Fe-4S dicluster domain-containing protein [Bauldia sp.]|nr:4Fe-4S dicluster domain-containing protein [Bauldia sp.]